MALVKDHTRVMPFRSECNSRGKVTCRYAAKGVDTLIKAHGCEQLGLLGLAHDLEHVISRRPPRHWKLQRHAVAVG